MSDYPRTIDIGARERLSFQAPRSDAPEPVTRR
jgi:hypothetical protein